MDAHTDRRMDERTNGHKKRKLYTPRHTSYARGIININFIPVQDMRLVQLSLAGSHHRKI